VVECQKVAPSSITEYRCTFRRAHEVREQHRGEHGIGYRRSRRSVREGKERIRRVVGVGTDRETAEFDDLGVGDTLGDEAGGAGCLGTAEHERGHADRAEHVRDIGLHLHPEEVGGGGGADRKAVHPDEGLEELGVFDDRRIETPCPILEEVPVTPALTHIA